MVARKARGKGKSKPVGAVARKKRKIVLEKDVEETPKRYVFIPFEHLFPFWLMLRNRSVISRSQNASRSAKTAARKSLSSVGKTDEDDDDEVAEEESDDEMDEDEDDEDYGRTSKRKSRTSRQSSARSSPKSSPKQVK
jgi:hypothetical protein